MAEYAPVGFYVSADPYVSDHEIMLHSIPEDSEDLLPEGWIELFTPDGTAYYWHRRCQVTQWTRPLDHSADSRKFRRFIMFLHHFKYDLALQHFASHYARWNAPTCGGMGCPCLLLHHMLEAVPPRNSPRRVYFDNKSFHHWVQLAREVLNANPDALRECNVCGLLPLHACLQRQAPATITIAVLEQYPDAVPMYNRYNQSSLEIACRYGTTDAVARILCRGNERAAVGSVTVFAAALTMPDISRELFVHLADSCPSIREAIEQALEEDRRGHNPWGCYKKRQWSKMAVFLLLEYAHKHGIGDLVSTEACIVKVSNTFSKMTFDAHRGFFAQLAFGASTMSAYKCAAGNLPGRQAKRRMPRLRFLSTWHRGEALYKRFIADMLTKVFPTAAASEKVSAHIADILFGKCPAEESGCVCSTLRFAAKAPAGWAQRIQREAPAGWA